MQSWLMRTLYKHMFVAKQQHIRDYCNDLRSGLTPIHHTSMILFDTAQTVSRCWANTLTASLLGTRVDHPSKPLQCNAQLISESSQTSHLVTATHCLSTVSVLPGWLILIYIRMYTFTEGSSLIFREQIVHSHWSASYSLPSNFTLYQNQQHVQ